jgi:hypothetical protein
MAASANPVEPSVTGVSAAGANGDVALFIAPSEVRPTRLLMKGQRIWIAGPDRIISDEWYGKIAAGNIERSGQALVVEVIDGGEVKRITLLKLEG